MPWVLLARFGRAAAVHVVEFAGRELRKGMGAISRWASSAGWAARPG